MYNVGFGDCFCIRDRKSSLLVDFGAANSKIEGRPRREVFDVIISDLTTIRKKNLLLTHFHPDHVSGLLYMMRYRRDAYEFEKIYLPDVFSDPEMKYTLTLLLLADVTKKASLPGRRVSLFALAEALCARKVKIDLLSRGSEFEGKYTALWPDVRTVSSETEDVFNSLIENNEKAMTELVNIAEEVRQLFMSMTEDENEADVNLGAEKEVVDAAGKQTDSDSAGSVQGNNGTQEYAQAELRHRLKPEKLEKKFRELQATLSCVPFINSNKNKHNIRIIIYKSKHIFIKNIISPCHKLIPFLHIHTRNMHKSYRINISFYNLIHKRHYRLFLPYIITGIMQIFF